MVARVGWYILFLIIFAVYLLLVAYNQKKQQEALTSKKRSVFLSNQLNILAGMIPLVLIPWVLSGFFDRAFVLLILAAFEASALLVYLGFYAFRLTPKLVAMRYVLWGAEVAVKYPQVVRISLSVFGIIVLGGYFVAASYVYFSTPVHSSVAIRETLTLNMGLFLLGAFVAIAWNIALVTSAQLNDRTRHAVLLSQAASALPMGAILTVYLALMGIGAERFVPHGFTLWPVVSQYVPLVVLTAFYLLVLVVPYFIGLEERRRGEIVVYGALLDRVNKIIDAIGIPSSQDIAQVSALRSEFEDETDEWLQSEPMARVADDIETSHGAVDEKIQALVAPYRAFKDQDLRFIRLAAMRNLDSNLSEVSRELSQFPGESYRTEVYIKLCESFAAHFKDQRQVYESKLKAAEERKVFVPVVARLVPILGAVPVVFQYAQKLISMLPHAQ